MTETEKLEFGNNVRQHRSLRGWSMKELAGIAGISTKTVENIESGIGCSPRVETKVATALGALRSRLRLPMEYGEGHYRIMRCQEPRWYFSELGDADRYHTRMVRAGLAQALQPVREDPDSIQDNQERFRLGTTGQSVGFIQVLSGALEAGRFMVCTLELFARSPQGPDSSQYTYQIYMLQGCVRFVMGDIVAELRAGDSFVFTHIDSFFMEPTVPIANLNEVPRYLTMRLAVLPNRIGR